MAKVLDATAAGTYRDRRQTTRTNHEEHHVFDRITDRYRQELLPGGPVMRERSTFSWKQAEANLGARWRT